MGIGMGYVPPEFARRKTPIQVEIRGNLSRPSLWPNPFIENLFDLEPRPCAEWSDLCRMFLLT